MRLSVFAASLAASLLMLLAVPATAEVFRCKMPDGRMAYQDVACQENDDQKVVAPSRIAPPPQRRMTEQDYYDQRLAYQNQQARYRERMQAQQVAQRDRNARPYVAGIGGDKGLGRNSACIDDAERRKQEVRSGAYRRSGNDSDAIQRRREQLEKCNE